MVNSKPTNISRDKSKCLTPPNNADGGAKVVREERQDSQFSLETGFSHRLNLLGQASLWQGLTL